jgi:hypothetical protein
MVLDDAVCPSRRAVANLNSCGGHTRRRVRRCRWERGAGSWERRKVASLLRHGVSVEARDERGRAALMAAAQVGRTNAVDALAGTHSANELGSHASSASSNHLQ